MSNPWYVKREINQFILEQGSQHGKDTKKILYGWLNKSTTELGRKVDQIFNKQWIKKL